MAKGNLFEVDKYCTQLQGVDMVNSKRARREKSRYGQEEVPTSSQKTCQAILSGYERQRSAPLRYYPR